MIKPLISPASPPARLAFCHGLLGSAIALCLAACGGEQTDRQPAASKDLTTEERLAAAPDLANGERQFMACAVCHDRETDKGHRVGPNLAGIYGAPAARHPDFGYSKAMKDSGLIWTDETLDAYIERPVAVVPRGRMAFPGEPDQANRRDIIAYMKTFK